MSAIISSCAASASNSQKNHFTTPEDNIRKEQNQRVLEKIKYGQDVGKGYEKRIYDKWLDYIKQSDFKKKHDLYYPDANFWFGIIYVNIDAPFSKENIHFNGGYSTPLLYDDDLNLVDSSENFEIIGRWLDYDYLYDITDKDGNFLYLYIHSISLQDAKFKKVGHDIEIEKNPDTLAEINDVLMYTFTPPKNT